MPPHFFEVRRRFRRQLRQHYVPQILRGCARITFESFEREDLRAALDQALGEQKSRRQFEVVPRRAHRDAERICADADFQWLLGG